MSDEKTRIEDVLHDVANDPAPWFWGDAGEEDRQAIVDRLAAALRDSGWVDPDEAAKLREQVTIMEGAVDGSRTTARQYEQLNADRAVREHALTVDLARLRAERDAARDDAAAFSAAATSLGKDNDRLGDELDAARKRIEVERAIADNWRDSAHGLLPVVEAARAWVHHDGSDMQAVHDAFVAAVDAWESREETSTDGHGS